MTPESIVESIPSWAVKAKYVVLGVIILLILCLFIYMYKTLSSYSRHLQNLTKVVSEHEERLNHQSKLFSYNDEKNTNASLNRIMEEKTYDKLPDVFQIPEETQEIFIEKEPEPRIDFETELAEEIQELMESHVETEKKEETDVDAPTVDKDT
jgi:uncharacterized membrane protein YdfJ with MMPL/SSD domain